MPQPIRQDAKLKALQQGGAANARSDRVGDPLFQQNPFFDPRDLVQVKYEMLRRVQADGMSVSAAASAFGFSRVAFYRARQRFQSQGLRGLLPQPRGPKRAHKLSDPVLAFVHESKKQDPSLRAPRLAHMVQGRFGVSVHARTIERALARRKRGLR